MCQLNAINLHDEQLNKLLFLIMGSFGSTVHDDGWGVAGCGTKICKSAMPMYGTLDSGELIENMPLGNTPLLGHIRAASPQVPVNKANAHPFQIGNLTFAHNGKLVPKKEEDFIMEIEVQSLDKEGKKEYHKDGTPKMLKVKRSDSLIFFEKFVEIWKSTPGKDQDEKFVTVLQETMKLFTGKFAMLFYIGNTMYVVRGRTADLHISYWTESSDEDAKVLGWAINTDGKTLDWSTNLLSNMEQLNGGELLWFTLPKALEAETIYKAADFGLIKLGEIKEETSPVATYGNYRRDWGAGDGNFSRTTDSGSRIKSELEPLFREIYEFLVDYSMYPSDLSNIFMAVYQASLAEATLEMIKDFTKRILPLLRNMTNKDIRKRIKKLNGNMPVGYAVYTSTVKYPWVFNEKKVQENLISNSKKLLN
jgi:predicted glutamine amidotransferase